MTGGQRNMTFEEAIMIARRELLGSAVLGRTFGTAPAAMPQQVSERSIEEVVKAIRDLRTSIEAQDVFNDIAPLRVRLVEFLRAHMKFPDFIEVGTDMWIALYDWHVKHLQPIALGRDQSGRYTLTFMQTAVIMRPDMVQSYIGPPYDNR
jgi:hypothetical protein